MRKVQTLWVDLNVSLKEAQSTPELNEYCARSYCSDPGEIDRFLAHGPIDVICFDFDYPDRFGLRCLRDTKAAHASVPIIMLTLQHSEALAIWAFRARVWDYLVKPVPKHEVERCFIALLRATSWRSAQPARALAFHANRIPDEVSYAPKREDLSLAPAIFYVEKYFRSRIRSEEVAALCGMSPFRFSRAFRDGFGMTFRDYVVGYRVKEACRLLENPAATVTDVAFAVGFNDASYFTRIFKQRVGIAPSLLLGHTLEEIARSATCASLPNLPEILV